MLDWEVFVNKINEDINNYCKQNSINLEECLKYLKSFVELNEQNADEGLRESFIPNLLKIKTIFYRLARYNENSIFFKIYNFLDKTYIGNINIKKDLHDIFTVFAIKE